MSTVEKRQQSSKYLCGVANWHPAWMQRYATSKTFMAVYGLLGTIQAMSYMYFVVTLTTIERRFRIPSQTTGIILSGNEISQIMLSLILSYIGGQRNRPRWIAWGIVFCGLSCYILALPHFIYGAGSDTLQLTREYLDELHAGHNVTSTLSMVRSTAHPSSQHLCDALNISHECDTLLSIVPLILIFLSQFVLGVGNTLYYSLGQTYLDDNTKKTNTPLMLAMAMSLRMIGPIVGFLLGFLSLNMFIDPTRTPLIDNKDPRWLGAWWFGWMILGTLMIIFSGLIGLFPKVLPKQRRRSFNSHMPHALRSDVVQLDESAPLGSGFSSNSALDTHPAGNFPELRDFPNALMRLLRNKLLIYNIVSAIFYILGAAGYMTFLTKYMEVQFHRNAQSATIVVGPMSIIGMVIGLLGSGLIISKKKPSPSKVLMWNVIVGCVYIVGQISYMFMYCSDPVSFYRSRRLNLTTTCNANCSCEGVPYTPICHVPTDVTFFSPCHAGCHSWNSQMRVYSNCSCLLTEQSSSTPSASHLTTPMQILLPSTLHSKVSSMSSTHTTDAHYTSFSENSESSTTVDDFITDSAIVSQNPRVPDSHLDRWSDVLRPGVCLKGCNIAFWTFTAASMIVNWFGSSGRIGNMLVNYRAVSPKDKSFAQGLSLMMVSLFALIPGPIIFGRIIDSTCLVWTKTCSGKGNCQLYDQTSFRYFVNSFACCLTFVGVIFDLLVWYHGRHLDLYGDREAKRLQEKQPENKPITPLLAKK